ncbi:putative ribonuclease H-like domain-containing protein [Tanacetum coccineum]
MSYLSKTAHSTVKRPIHKNRTLKNSNFNQRVNTVKDKNVNTVRLKAVVNAAKLKAIVNAARPKAVVNAVKRNNVNAIKASACWIQVSDGLGPQKKLIFLSNMQGNPQMDLQDQGVIDSGCSRHMTGNMSYLTDYEEIDGGYVAFGGNPKGGKITSRGTIKTGNLDFENVYFVRELKFNLFSVSQMCDKKNSVLFNDTECIVLSPNFKLTDESHVLLKVPRKNNMYSVDLKNIVPKGGLTCLFAKATSDESKLWHRRLGHINFKTMNKLVKGNLVRGLPSKLFENDQTCVACQKGKQHRASCKSKTVSSISQPLHMLHMDLFGPTFVKSLMKKMYCLVVTDDYSRFSWVFFLATKDETSGILNSFITGVENLIDQRVKVISVARTPQQNRVAERKNRTLIKAARIMLADFKLPTTFWAEAVNTACYVQNRVLVIKPHNKTPYELFLGRKPALGFMRPFRCPVTIPNTIDHLGKFDGKADEGFFVGYSINSKAFRVFNSRTRIVEENMHVQFGENTPNIEGSGPNWLFDINALKKLLNYKPVVAGNQSKSSPDAGFKASGDDEKKVTEEPLKEGGDSSKDSKCSDQEKEDNVNSTNTINAASINEVNVVGAKTSIELPNDPNIPELEDIVYSDDDEDVGVEADMNNLDAFMPISPILTIRVHKDRPVEQIIGDLNSAPQTRRMTKNLEEHVTQVLEVVPFEEQSDDLKKILAKNKKAKMVLHNALPKKEYERIFMCKTAKDIWQSLLITHQGNSQVKDNKIDLLVQQYEQFTILEEESIDSGFARFNTIIPSLKALDEAQDALIGNLKVHEVVMEKDYEIYKDKKERVKPIALKAKKDSSDDETLTSRSDDEEYATAIRNFKKFFRIKGKFVRQPRGEKKSFRQRDEKKGKNDRKCFRCGDPNHLIGVVPKPFVTRSNGLHWRFLDAIAITGDVEDKTKRLKTCLMAHLHQWRVLTQMPPPGHPQH